jgi:hypothetical protein
MDRSKKQESDLKNAPEASELLGNLFHARILAKEALNRLESLDMVVVEDGRK